MIMIMIILIPAQISWIMVMIMIMIILMMIMIMMIIMIPAIEKDAICIPIHTVKKPHIIIAGPPCPNAPPR